MKIPPSKPLSRRQLFTRATGLGAGTLLATTATPTLLAAGGVLLNSAITTATAQAGAAPDLDTLLRNAVAAENLPFAVAMVGNADDILWSGSAGERAPGEPAALDTAMRIFSMTKAIGSTAAMLLIDRGKLDIDAPVASILPQFAELQVLDGFDGEQPILRAPKTQATVRHLATHTSGLSYEFWNPKIAKYLQLTKHPTVISGLKAALNYPLSFDPGERWDYGLGIDWLGQVVEAVDGRRIDQFCHEEIFAPLAMADTQFEPDTLNERLADVSIRGEDGKFSAFEIAPPPQPEVYGMGHALYSTAPDYMRFLRMLLNRGELDGQRLLSEAGVATMLENSIGDIRIDKMISVAPPITADVELFPGIDTTHSFAFVRNEQQVPGGRSAGSQGWAGVCNTHFWFDPSSNLAGLLMTQSLPFVEPRFIDVYRRFEQTVYKSFA